MRLLAGTFILLPLSLGIVGLALIILAATASSRDCVGVVPSLTGLFHTGLFHFCPAYALPGMNACVLKQR